MKDQEARDRASSAHVRMDSVETRLNKKIADLERELADLQKAFTEHNRRLYRLDEKVFPTCHACGQTLTDQVIDRLNRQANNAQMEPSRYPNADRLADRLR
jgi:hypothetical protein